jgi:hypothetical protein
MPLSYKALGGYLVILHLS